MFKKLIRAILGELRQFYENNLRMQSPNAKQMNQLRIMFGAGEIDKTRFFMLENRIRRGQLLQGELSMIHREAQLKREAKGELLHYPTNPEIARALNRLYLDRARLEEARSEIERITQTLAGEASWVRDQAEAIRKDARASLPDEDEARGFLHSWQDLLAYASKLEKRSLALKRELGHMDALEAELRSCIAQLLALDSQNESEAIRTHINLDIASKRAGE